MDVKVQDVKGPIGSNVTVSEFKRLTLTCDVSRYGRIDKFWTFNGKVGVVPGVDRRGNVVLPKVKVKDSGVYECYSSDQAKVKFGAVRVKVLGKTNYKNLYFCFQIPDNHVM